MKIELMDSVYRTSSVLSYSISSVLCVCGGNNISLML